MLSEKIKKLRISQGLSQAAFAARLFVTPGAVSQWETGRSIPDTERLMAIAKEFSIPLDYFSDTPDGKEYSETELIRQHLLIELSAEQPKTPEAQLLAKGIDKMPKADRERALNIMKAAYSDYFERAEDKIG